ncbi:MAG: hypothetical protein ACJAWH_001023 [Maribacter sp.]|jgi:hypothetical protein
MISNIFGKTKPINLIILLGFLFLFYWTVQVYLFETDFATNQMAVEIVVLSILLFSVFVVDFIVNRNKLTGANSYAIFFYTLLFVVFPETLSDSNAILCSLFLLLATRRLLSIKSLKEIKSKVFDATLWVLAASLFYDWAIVYLVLVFVTIYIYEPKNIRNWLVTLSASFSFFIIMFTGLILANNTDFLIQHYSFEIDFAAIYPPKWDSSIKVSVYIIINLILALGSFLALGKGGVGKIITIRLVSLSFVLGLLVNLLVLTESTYAIMITFFPSVIFICNYIESIKKKNLLELALVLSVVVPLLVFIAKIWVG